MNPRLLGAHDIVAASATCCVVVGRFTVAVSVLLPKPAGSVAAPGAKPAVAPPTAASSSKLYSLLANYSDVLHSEMHVPLLLLVAYWS